MALQINEKKLKLLLRCTNLCHQRQRWNIIIKYLCVPTCRGEYFHGLLMIPWMSFSVAINGHICARWGANELIGNYNHKQNDVRDVHGS